MILDKNEEALVERCAGALVPFVETWNLPLSPEDVWLMAGAVLTEAGVLSKEFDWSPNARS